MSTTTAACSANFKPSRVAQLAVMSMTLALLAILAVVYRYGAWTHGWAAIILIPSILWLCALLIRKARRLEGYLLLSQDGQVTVQYTEENLHGEVQLPLLLSDLAILICLEHDGRRRQLLIMRDAVGPDDFRQLSASLLQRRHQLVGQKHGSLE
ncbi:hypothetical protein K0504_00865 [Neiella marina]|uniref:Toxin CptA n=1 Tax=Neiella holothuriorum TaxID=2870530 RepID=A0ABS7EBD7_9GAMM|nr:protein YgfX [Neiella holothuriorum]MBW8189570.1 hypothetical protein [Neiella holothuriorum]